MLTTSTLLNIERVKEYHFRTTHHQQNPNGSIFGGQILAQMLMAATKTVRNVKQRLPHSVHAYFISPGKGQIALDFYVTKIKDGRSFSIRKVEVNQKDKLIFSASVSFQDKENGFSHHSKAKNFPGPPPSEMDLLATKQKIINLAGAHIYTNLHNNLFEIVGTTHNRQILSRNNASAEFWVRNRMPLDEDDICAQIAALTGSTDIILFTSLVPYMKKIDRRKLQIASLDHNLWIHKTVNMNLWHYVETESPWAANGCALVTMRLFNDQGYPVASAAQEGLIRHP